MKVFEMCGVSVRGRSADVGRRWERIRSRLTGKNRAEEHWTIKSVSFSLDEGDVLGVIGAQSDEKEALLKVASGLMSPASGNISCDGHSVIVPDRVMGVDEDRSVREAVYTLGALFGCTRRRITEDFDQIIRCAGLNGGAEEPFQTLPDAMRAQLAVATALRTQSKLLIRGGILQACGETFREALPERIRAAAQDGHAVILVADDTAFLQKTCGKVLWLHKGRQIAFDTDVAGVCSRYEAFLSGDVSLTDGADAAAGEEKPADCGAELAVNAGALSNNILIRAFLVLFIALMLLAVRYARSAAQWGNAYGLLHVCVLAFAYIIITRAIADGKKSRELGVLFLIIISGMVLRWSALAFFQTQPASDVGLFHEFIDQYRQKGPYTEVVPWNQRDRYQLYYSRFPAWFMIMRISMFVYDILGKQPIYMQRINILLAGVSMLLIYGVIPQKRAALMATAFFSFDPSWIIYSCGIIPDHFTILFILLALFCWLRAERYRREWPQKRKKALLCIAAASVSCALVNCFKPLSVIFIVAFLCYEAACYIYPVLKQQLHRKEKLKRILCYDLVFLICLSVCVAGGNYLLRREVESMMKTKVVDSTGLYLAWGFSVTEDGIYDTRVTTEMVDKIILKYDNDYEKAFPEINELAKDLIKKNISFDLFKQKFIALFGHEVSYFYVANSTNNEENDWNRYELMHWPLEFLMLTYMRIIYILCAVLGIFALFGKKVEKTTLLAAIISFGYILMLMFSGIQDRYKSLVVPLWCILAGQMVDSAAVFLTDAKRKAAQRLRG